MSGYVDSMRTTWTTPVASYHSRYANFDDLIVYHKPARHMPIRLGCYALAEGPERPALKFGETAGGFLKTSPKRRSTRATCGSNRKLEGPQGSIPLQPFPPP